ncbi:MAG: hypothetical protein ABH834_05060 [Candidatus Altiarchaeota archaeon]
MVSFADVQSIYRNEKNMPSLQIIPRDFFQDANALADSLEGEHRKHLNKLLEEIILRRRNKIVLHALRISDDVVHPTNIHPMEEDFFAEVASLVTGYKKKFLEAKPVKKKAQAPSPAPDVVSVRIVKAIPEIVGSDSNSYGPFKEDDVVELPRENADILLKRGFAEAVSTE